MELLKRSMILTAVLSLGMSLAACQTSGKAGGEVRTPSGAGVGGSVGASGSVDTPNSNTGSKSDSSTSGSSSGSSSTR